MPSTGLARRTGRRAGKGKTEKENMAAGKKGPMQER